MRDPDNVAMRMTGFQLSSDEKDDIEQQIDFEIIKAHHSMLKLGAGANIIGGALYVFLLINQNSVVEHRYVFYWYLLLAVTNILNMIWAVRFEKRVTMKTLMVWRKLFLVFFMIICLTWGSIGIYFVAGSVQDQLLTFAFLLAVLIAFSFATIIDFMLATVGIVCLLVPTLSYRISMGLYNLIIDGHDKISNFGVSAALFVLGVFMLAACYFGSRLVRKFFRLNFENFILASALERSNAQLEQRVQERTMDLENSLKLVQYQATHDLLTELPNQRFLLEHINTSIENAIRQRHMFAVCGIIINELEKINEALGPQAVDIVLKRIAQRFEYNNSFESKNESKISSYSFAISRRDLFVALIDPINEPSEVEKKAEYLFSMFNNPIIIDEHKIQLTVSIGVSVYPINGVDDNTLIMHSVSAAQRAKEHGGNKLFIYNAEIDADISRMITMDSQLHSALQNNEFKLQYQPFVDLKSNKICGVEVLLRWKNAILGNVPPGEFISIAEANGSIIPIGEWVLRTACKQVAIWHKRGFDTLQISVNTSATQCQQSNIVKVISDILSSTPLKPNHLMLELTESKAYRKEIIPIINDITALGVCLSIDDFGTGYSALSSLKLFKIDMLKIDKSFIDDVATDNDSKDIVMNTIALGKRMNIKVLAEGVETKEQFEFLQKNGCDIVQGYYVSKPLDVDAFTNLLDIYSGKPADFISN